MTTTHLFVSGSPLGLGNQGHEAEGLFDVPKSPATLKTGQNSLKSCQQPLHQISSPMKPFRCVTPSVLHPGLVEHSVEKEIFYLK